MFKNLLPLGTDEIIAIIVLIVTLILPQAAFLTSLQGLAVVYLLICVAIRKYDLVRQKYDKPLK